MLLTQASYITEPYILPHTFLCLLQKNVQYFLILPLRLFHRNFFFVYLLLRFFSTYSLLPCKTVGITKAQSDVFEQFYLAAL